jgi:DNA-binding response OmpR family regulator
MKERVLFVDDERNILDGLRRMLHAQEPLWEMHFVQSAAEAVELLSGLDVDAAVVDVSMPGMSGLELLADIKSRIRTRDIEVVILTGLQEQHLKREALDLGAADLLNKPVQAEDLVARLRSVLRMKAYRDELKQQQAVLERRLIEAQRTQLVGAVAGQLTEYLNGLLTRMVWYSELATAMFDGAAPADLEGSVAQARENLAAIEHYGNSAKGLLTHVLRFSQSEPREPGPCDLVQVVRECLDITEALKPKGLVVDWHTEVETATTLAKPVELYQGVLDLCLVSLSAPGNGKLLVRLGHRPTQPPAVACADSAYGWHRLVLQRSKPEGNGRWLENGTQVSYLPVETAQGESELVVASHIFTQLGGCLVTARAPRIEPALVAFLPASSPGSSHAQ